MVPLRGRFSQKIADDLKEYFAENTLWEYEKVLGEGAMAVTILVRERKPDGVGQRMAVKRSKNRYSENSLRKEIDWLKKLRGAEHCGQMLISREDGMDPVPLGGSRSPGFFESIRDLRENAFRGLLGPVMGLEYLENGTLSSLLEMIESKDMHLPNRVLWSFLLCMVRACVALAYPPNGSEYEPTELETIPSEKQESNVYHGDLHLGNIMIGSYDGRFNEHRVVPVVKFIDFGQTTVKATIGVTRNLFIISLKLLSLVVRDNLFDSDLSNSMYNGIETRATEILPHGNGANYPRLDPNLRDYLARCLAAHIGNRPGLKDMLHYVEQVVQSQSEKSFAPDIQPFETDDAIRDTLQELLHNADV